MTGTSVYRRRTAFSAVAAGAVLALWAVQQVGARADGQQAGRGEQAAVISVPAPSSAATLLRQPYLQRMSADAVTVVWATYEAGAAEVRYAPASGGPTATAPATTTLYAATRTQMAQDYYQHEATLNGLSSATTYRYDVYLDGLDLTDVSDEFTTAPPNGSGTVSFVVFGDSGSGNQNQQRLADRIAADFQRGRWDLALHTGDIVYPKGSYQLLHDRFFSVYQEWLRGWPIYFGLGNHEYYVDNAQPYLDLFVAPDNAYDPLVPTHRERYYSFDFGPVHFISLDTNGLSGSSRPQQLTWLVRDLESTTQPWRVVFMHIPAYGSTDSDYNIALRSALQPIFERYGVQLVLAGHEHDYARGTPWREEGPHAAVMHVVSGGGGAGLNQPSAAPWLVNWASAFHYLSVTIRDCLPASACDLTLEAIGDDGVPFDTFTLPLRAQQQDVTVPQIDWIQPAQGAILSGATAVSGSVVDDQQIVKVDLLVDGRLRSVDATPPYEWSWDTTADLNGPRTLQLRAVDIAGRVSTSSARTVQVRNQAPTIRLLSPQASERVFTEVPFKIRWAAEAGAHPLTSFRLDLASDGKTFKPLAGCESLASTVRECVWSTPAPVSTRARIRLTATDQSGMAVSQVSALFRVQTGVPTLTVAYPNTAIKLGAGSSAALRWTTKLAYSELQLEMSRDGASTWEVIAPSVATLNGEVRWRVTEPLTSQALFRVRSLNTPLQDTSNVGLAIAAPSLSVAAPTAATIWRVNSPAVVRWNTNLGAYDRVNVRLSTDGGQTFPIVLAGSVVASTGRVTVTVPAAITQTARIMVESLTNPDWRAVNPASFKIVPQ